MSTSKLLFKDPIEAEPSKPKMVLYGASGVGKTWFTLSFPNVAYFSPEPGATRKHYVEKLRANGGMYLGPEDGSTDFEVLISQAKALATEKHKFKTLAVDSITEIFNLAVAKEADRLGAKNAFGADKKPAIAYMRRFVSAISRLDMNVILVAHEKTEWGQDDTGQRVEKGKIPDCYDKLIYSLDLAFQAQKRGASRVAIVKKSRLMGFPEGESFPLEFADFSTRYGKDIIEKAVTPIALANAEQVEEIERLVGLLKIEPDTIEKWFEKANVEKFSEFSIETADKIIKSLTSKLK